MAFDRFDIKQGIYTFYKTYGMDGIEMLYSELYRIQKMQEVEKNLDEKIAIMKMELSTIIRNITTSRITSGIHIA